MKAEVGGGGGGGNMEGKRETEKGGEGSLCAKLEIDQTQS